MIEREKKKQQDIKLVRGQKAAVQANRYGELEVKLPNGGITFNRGENELFVRLKNNQRVIVHSSGRYLPINPGEAIKGFEDRYYFYKGGGSCTVGNPGEMGVVVNGHCVFIPEGQAEIVTKLNNGQRMIVRIDGRHRFVHEGKTESGFFDNAYRYLGNGEYEIIPVEEHEAPATKCQPLGQCQYRGWGQKGADRPV